MPFSSLLSYLTMENSGVAFEAVCGGCVCVLCGGKLCCVFVVVFGGCGDRLMSSDSDLAMCV